MEHESTARLHGVSEARDEQQAFAERVFACRRTLFAAAMAITRNPEDAEDAVQEAVMRAWRKLDTLKEPAYFSTWITRIAIRAAIDINRRRRPQTTVPEQLAALPAKADLALDIRRAVDGLDEKLRLCAVLYYFEDLPVKEIARITGSFEGTVKSRLRKARTTMRGALEGYEDGE